VRRDTHGSVPIALVPQPIYETPVPIAPYLPDPVPNAPTDAVSVEHAETPDVPDEHVPVENVDGIRRNYRGTTGPPGAAGLRLPSTAAGKTTLDTLLESAWWQGDDVLLTRRGGLGVELSSVGRERG
jgi:hypothetical protein